MLKKLVYCFNVPRSLSTQNSWRLIMKTVLKFATYLIINFSCVFVTNFALSAGLYIEGQIMQNNINTVETGAYSGTVSGVTFTNLKGNLDYNSKEANGLELGYKLNDNFRFGLQFTEFQLDFSKGSITGTATDGNTTISAAADVTEADVTALGLKFDNNVSFFIINSYYDFKKIGAITPFAGLGVGSANISNATQQELALVFTGGLSYDISDKIYLGARLSYVRLDSLEDTLGIKYQTPVVISSAVSLGYRF